VSLLEILQVYVERYAQALSVLQSSANRVQQLEDFWEDDPTFIPGLLQWLILMDETCEQDEFPVTRVPVSEVKGIIEIAFSGKEYSKLAPVLLTQDSLFNQLERIRLSFTAELSTKLFFQLPSNKKKWFEAPTSNWEKVIERFPNTITDIEEMNKCFALSRYAGAVFHSVQIIEFSLLDFGAFLEVKDPKSGWTAISSKLDQITKTKFSDLSDKHHKAFPFIEQMQATVLSLKNAWRNKISHAQAKLTLLTSDFTPDVAEEILMATRAFMRRLATEMPT
jgi:hypothetical protein